ncbi:2-hydroxyacid dehydrogenase [Blastocystis sp. subtype 4]|uniref:2-hydroxyacid dehydrogenase n=1 Tax=Blastocystis sp. subtype 4 TaxID=944170 RepID=UPI000711C315|nr:2-hydroxyacid dehydrogenase [Blastocystis sp. subtype 4]KNB45134.1 2-hydroxyacid dehydrogenase [Blastocystis sp. subtype 4]|eukprot:XP_014528572.1 2-hydroxyacid dehydrogenase [Blastocystis sp. subtype 4]
MLKKLALVESYVKEASTLLNFSDSDSQGSELDQRTVNFLDSINTLVVTGGKRESLRLDSESVYEPEIPVFDQGNAIAADLDSVSHSTVSTQSTLISQGDDDSSLHSQLSTSSEDEANNTAIPRSHIIESALVRQPDSRDSVAVYRFLSTIGHENPVPSVFDPSGAGVDFFLLPVFYTPRICGCAPETAIQVKPNAYIADRYLVIRQLGKATFSVTVECIDMRGDVNNRLCLKIIRNGDFFFDQSLDEIRVLRYLNGMKGSECAHILQLYDFFYNKRHLMIVMELLQDNLYEFMCSLDRNPLLPEYFTLNRIAVILKQVLEALEFIHMHNIIHCDLKPENILISDKKKAQIKLVDFGGANFASSLQSASSHQFYIQSRSYRAPEIILGIDFDERIDIWSLGCIAAELFTHSLLFDNSSVGSLLTSASAIIGEIPMFMIQAAGLKVSQRGDTMSVHLKQGEVWTLNPCRKDLNVELECDCPEFVDFVSMLLQWDPAQRPTAAQALQHPFIRQFASCSDYEGDLDSC